MIKEIRNQLQRWNQQQLWNQQQWYQLDFHLDLCLIKLMQNLLPQGVAGKLWWTNPTWTSEHTKKNEYEIDSMFLLIKWKLDMKNWLQLVAPLRRWTKSWSELFSSITMILAEPPKSLSKVIHSLSLDENIQSKYFKIWNGGVATSSRIARCRMVQVNLKTFPKFGTDCHADLTNLKEIWIDMPNASENFLIFFVWLWILKKEIFQKKRC